MNLCPSDQGGNGICEISEEVHEEYSDLKGRKFEETEENSALKSFIISSVQQILLG